MKLIISADYHLRNDLPKCRMDEDWIQTQKDALSFISESANKRNAAVAVIGDIFHQANVPAKIVSMFIEFVQSVKNGVYILAGNHDLQYHNWNNLHNSSFSILDSLVADKRTNLHYLSEIGDAQPFGITVEPDKMWSKILFIHELIFPSKKELPTFIKARTANDLIKEYKNADLICTGDNHNHFYIEKNNVHVINPGCITRQTADMKDYQPVIYYVDTDDLHSIKSIKLPDNKEIVITDRYLKMEDDRENRIEAFVTSIRESKDISLDFADNVRKGIQKNKFSIKTIQIINELIEE